MKLPLALAVASLGLLLAPYCEAAHDAERPTVHYGHSIVCDAAHPGTTPRQSVLVVTVLRAEGHRMGDASVIVHWKDDRPDFWQLTNADGSAAIVGLPDGDYDLRIERSAYQPATLTSVPIKTGCTTGISVPLLPGPVVITERSRGRGLSILEGPQNNALQLTSGAARMGAARS